MMDQFQSHSGEGPIFPREIARGAVSLLDELGKGAFGLVYKGIMREVASMPGYLVAVKSLHETCSATDKQELLEEAAVMAQFQHPHVTSLEQIKEEGLPVYIAAFANTTFWPWLKSKYGYTDDMIRPYTFSVAPFLADTNIVQQGYLSSEPFAMEKAGIKPSVFLLADYGYPAYATTIETTDGLIEKDPDLVRRFVQASMEGWASYFKDPAPGNALIKEANPEMTDEQIAYGIAKMQEYGLVTGGDAATRGIGVMTDARWAKIHEFMLEAGLVDASLDIHDVYSLDYLPAEPVLP